MDRADKAVLRLAIGLGLAVLIAYGLLALTLAFVVCVVAVALLSRPGPPIPLLKGVILAAAIATVMAAGVLMVPILENYALTGVLVTGALLYAVFWLGGGRATPQTMILVIALTLIPVAGVAEQALAISLAQALALGIGIGALVSGISHALFPDPPVPGRKAPAAVGPASAHRSALRATLVVLPVFVLALTNPSFYFAAVLKSVTLALQAGAATARSAGREMVGSTLMGAWMATLVWFGLSLRPNLVMLTLWLMGAALWAGARMFGIKATASPPSYWMNALVTMLILLGPAIEDSANGKGVLRASLIRVSLLVGVAVYAWATVWALERWRAPGSTSTTS